MSLQQMVVTDDEAVLGTLRQALADSEDTLADFVIDHGLHLEAHRTRPAPPPL